MPETRLVMGPGLYRNHLGAEINLTRLYGYPLGELGEPPTIGAIWLAIETGSVLGRRYSLVTREGLEDAGYARVDGGPDDA